MKIKNERKVRALCKTGNKIEAIKVLRDSNQPRMGLFDAKEWVEREYPEFKPRIVSPEVEAQNKIINALNLLPESRRIPALKAAAVLMGVQL